ncbi:MAG: hypothetical protein RR415_12660 [Ruthenibacterium sp.]
MNLEEIIHSGEWIQKEGYVIENNILQKVDVDTIAHFGNCTCLELHCANVVPYSTYNNTKNLGLLIKTLVVFLGLEEEDGIRLSEIKNIPIRLVFDGGKAVGLGHFMSDKFFLFSEFSELGE